LNSNIKYILILLLAGFFIYHHSLVHEFLWDDHYLIEENTALKSPRCIIDFFSKDFWQNASQPYDSGFYRPVTLLSFFFNYQLWGTFAGGYHLFNVIFHCLNGMLLFCLFLRALNNKAAAFLTALLFLIHPVQSETVAFIADIGDILCVFFLLLMSLCYFQFQQQQRRGRYIFSICALVLALLSKENAMVGFALIMMLDFCFISKMKLNVFMKKMKIFTPYILVTGAYIILRVIVLGAANAITTLGNVRYVSFLPSFDLWTHLLTISKVLHLYVEMFLWPVHQSISYVILPAISLSAPDVIISVSVVMSLFALLGLSIRSHSWLSFALAWFLLTIIPVSNLIPISNTIAERFMYLPSIGLCFALGNAAALLYAKYHSKKIQQLLLSCIIAIIFSGLSIKTISRNFDWASDYTLFLSALNTKPCSSLAHLNLAAYYNRQGIFHEGERQEILAGQCSVKITAEYRALKAVYENN